MVSHSAVIIELYSKTLDLSRGRTENMKNPFFLRLCYIYTGLQKLLLQL